MNKQRIKKMFLRMAKISLDLALINLFAGSRARNIWSIDL